MGCGASVVKPTGNSSKSSTPANQRTKVQTQASEVPTLMASLQGHMSNNNIHGNEDTKMVHIIDISNRLFPEKMPERIECDDIIEFKINGKDELDVFQVYKDGNDYYRVNNGYELLNIKNRTPENERRLLLSLALNQPEIDLYFCIIPSAERQIKLTTRKCPKDYCENNCLKIQKCEIKFSLTDEKESQKVYIHKGDIIEIDWTSKRGASYRIEEKKFCPVSGGLYTVEQTDDNISTRPSTKGKFSKTFNDFGMSFLFRLTDTNQIHDITVCIINDTYKIKHIEINEKNIQPNLIWIEQSDWIVFEWNTKRKQTIIEIEPYSINNKRQSIERKIEGKHFFWPYEATRRGFMMHQFNETGLYCYKDGNNQIGTIIVEPHKTIYHVPIFGEQLIHKMNTKNLVQFNWKMTDSQEDPVFITMDTNSSVIPDTAGGLTGIFDCAIHKCTKVESFFRHHFHTCETFLLNIPQHGLYNFSTTDNRNNTLISIIVENGIDNQRVTYNENNIFEPNTLIINRCDQVWIESSTKAAANIYQTDEFGNQLEFQEVLFQPQENSVNYFVKEFPQEGIFYFSTDIDHNNNKDKNQDNSTQPLAIIVVPDVRFHYRTVHKNDFDSSPIITNTNDFVIWQFNHIVTMNVIQLNSNEKLQDLMTSHERAVIGRNRQCLAVECMMPGTFFFVNPEFERGTGLEQDRLISTVIIDPPFSQNCFIITNRQFVPTVLNIGQNDTVSWIIANNERNPQIYVQSNDNQQEINEDDYIHRDIMHFVHDVYHLHTFNQPGQYTIRSNAFQTIAHVNVYSENTIRNQKRRVQEPKIIEDIDVVSEFGTQIHLVCPNRYANIHYTTDGSMPTRHFDNVQEYDPDTGVLLIEPGLRIIRAYAISDEKLSSTVITSSLTFVMESKELEAINERRNLWHTCEIKLSASLQQPNKLYGKIDVEPTNATDLIDHFELCINGVAQKKIITPTDAQFSADGFAGGSQYEINVIAYPKETILDAEPISSNKRAFDIRREVQGGAPLVSLSLSNEQNTLFLMWAHIGDHVSEYIVYVDNIETKIITDKDFKDFYGIQFHGAQQQRKYLLHVSAKIKDSNDIRKSNVIAVTLPLDIPFKGPISDRYFPYIVINDETPPSDIRLEKGSDRLSSPKLLVKNSSSPSSSPLPAASSRPNVHIIDVNNPTLNTTENIHQKTDDDDDDDDDDETNNLEQQPSSSPPIFNDASTAQIKLDEATEKPKSRRRKKKNKQQQENTNTTVLSDDSKQRAKFLLEILTQQIENRSKTLNSHHTHPHSSYHGIQHYKDDNLLSQRSSISSSDPFTNKLPPKIQRRSASLNKHHHIQTIQLSDIINPRPKIDGKIETLPITNGFRNAIPKISYKRNANGITLFWQTKPPAMADFVENYRIIVDGQPYGKLIPPSEETKYQINLLPGKHECYLEVISKDKNDEVFKSNVLKIDIQSPSNGLKHEQNQQTGPLNTPIGEVLEQKDIPIPKLTIQSTSTPSIRAVWYLDRPMPTGGFAALYEVHVRGQDFPDRMTSDEHSQQDGYIEHIWHVQNSPLEITGISDRQEYTIFVRALFHAQGLPDIKYVKTTSNEVTTIKVDPLIDLLSRPLLQITSVGLQRASLSWRLDDSVDQKLVKGYRIILNSKPTEILPSNQHEYELIGLKPGTENEVQVSVTSHPDFVNEKISEPIRIVCPLRPQPPIIESIKADKPFSISIKWKIDKNDQDEISSFKIFLDGKLYGEIETNGRQVFKYDFNKLQAEQTYSIYIKSVIEQKKLHGYVYQCEIESNVSNELSLKCATPPKGTQPKIERMDPSGIEISWDAPVEFGDVKLTGYQILKNERAIGKPLSIDQRQASINGLDIGHRYSFRILPVTDQPGGILLRTGEEYNSDRHGHYLPGPKLEVEYTDLIRLPRKFWVENITGHSALICWSPIDESSSLNIRPEGYKLSIWNNQDLTHDKPMIVTLTNDKTSVQLKDLQSSTTYAIQLEVYKERDHQTNKDKYIVSSISEVLKFDTGSPPDPPTNLRLIACTNTDARIGFDPFIEHNAEIITIRVQYETISSEINLKDVSFDLTPDSTEFILTNLIERTDYNVTIYGITEEYLNENHYRDIGQLPKKLKSSIWLPNKNLQFKTSGCESVNQLNIRQATTESIQIDWILPKVYGSTHYIRQLLRWKLDHGNEEQRELDRNVTQAKISGPLPSGSYKISLDSIFSVKINLEDDNNNNNNEINRKEICLTKTESVSVRFHTPGTRERPELYLTGYTTNTIDLTWNKPNLFDIIDHPERNNERLKIHRRLLGYRININGQKYNTLDDNQYRCTLTDCQSNEKYEVQLIARTSIQNQYMENKNDKDNVEQIDETSSKKLRIQMLKNQNILRSFQANFEFNLNENTTEQQNNNKSIGKIHINWKVSDTKNISHFILQWHSSKDLNIQQKTIPSNETSTTIDSCDEKYHYVIELIIVNNNGERYQFEQLTIPIPGEPDAPKLWLVNTSDTNFTIEWSEPKSYGIPIIGYELFIAGKKASGVIEINLRRAEIPSRINRIYEVEVRAITNNSQRLHSPMSEKLPVITTPITDLMPTMHYNNDDGNNSIVFDRSVARIIPLKIDTINEEKLYLDWTSFLPTTAIRAYYIQYICLINGDIQTMKVSKRHRQTILRDLRPGFTYGIMVMAVDKNGGILYTSDKSTIQMNAPPNAPIVNITERENTHVKIEWRPAASYGEIVVVGYNIFVNNRLAAILRHDQLTYTLTNGIPCDTYTVQVQALTNEKNTVSPMLRQVQFTWPGVKPGAFKRLDDGQTGNISVAWEHPKLEDETEKLLGYKLISENLSTRAERLHGEYDATTQQATIHDLNNGKYRLWLEIQTEKNCVRARPIVIMFGRFHSLLPRQTSIDSAKCFNKKQKRLRSPATGVNSPSLRHIQYS